MFRPLELAWNATLTHHGRLNLLYRWRRWRLRTFTEYGAGRPAVYRLLDGRKFVIHPGDHLSEQIANQRTYEPLESRIVAKILIPGDTAIDVGANVGYYTALCSAAVGGTGRVFSFEPGKSTFAKLQQTITLLGLDNVVSHEFALAEKCGFMDFVMSSSGSDAQQSLVDWEGLVGLRDVVRVKTTTLDAVVRDLDREEQYPAFVKCDVEGAEGKVLRGAQGMLRSDSPPIIMAEVNRRALLAQGSDVSELLKYLEGYRLYFTVLDSDRKRLEPLRSVADTPDLGNFFAFPNRGRYANRAALAKTLLG